MKSLQMNLIELVFTFVSMQQSFPFGVMATAGLHKSSLCAFNARCRLLNILRRSRYSFAKFKHCLPPPMTNDSNYK